MKLVHASIAETGGAGWDGNAKAGDQTGKEVCVRSWYSKPWDIVLRYPNKTLALKVSKVAIRLANSNLVGYDQSERMTLYEALKKFDFNVDAYINSGEKSEADCSSFVYAVYCCFIPDMRTNEAPVTAEMQDTYRKWGFAVLKDSEYLDGHNLISGDILVKEGSHTAMATNETEITPINNVLITMPELEIGSTGEAVKTIQNMLLFYGYDIGDCGIDGDFGSDTLSAVKAFQSEQGIVVDGIVGTVTYMYLLGAITKPNIVE